MSVDKIKGWTDEIALHQQELSRLRAKRDHWVAEQGMELNLDSLKLGPGEVVQSRLAELTALKAREKELENALTKARIDTQKVQLAYETALEAYNTHVNQFRLEHPYANLSGLPSLYKLRLEAAQANVAQKRTELTQARASSDATKGPRAEAAREAVVQAKVGLKAATAECKVLEKVIARSMKESSKQSANARNVAEREIAATIKEHQLAIKTLEKRIVQEQKRMPP